MNFLNFTLVLSIASIFLMSKPLHSNPLMQVKETYTKAKETVQVASEIWKLEDQKDYSFEDMKALMDKDGFNPNMIGRDGDPLIFSFLFMKDQRLLKYLVKKGANLNVYNKYGYTPLIVATRRLATTELLLKLGADPNILSVKSNVENYADYPGSSALDRALDSNLVYELLLKYGADPTLHPNFPRVDGAGSKRIAKILLRHYPSTICSDPFESFKYEYDLLNEKIETIESDELIKKENFNLYCNAVKKFKKDDTYQNALKDHGCIMEHNGNTQVLRNCHISFSLKRTCLDGAKSVFESSNYTLCKNEFENTAIPTRNSIQRKNNSGSK